MTYTNVLQWLEESAQRHADKISYADDKKELSYSELLTQVQSVGSTLAHRGKAQQAIAVLLPRGVDQVVALLGIAAAGGHYAILDAESPRERLANIVTSFKPAAILVCDQTAQLGEELLPGACIAIDEASSGDIDTTMLADIRCKTHPDDLLYVLYTSGSTGMPKGVMVSHANVISYVSWFANCFDISDETIFGSQTPLYFSMSVSDMFATIRQGATMHIIPKQLFSWPVPLVNWLNERKVNTIYWVPTALGMLSRWDVLSVAPLEHICKVLFAGEVMPTPTLNYWMDKLPKAKFANLFGPTETTDICTYYKVNRRLSDEESLPIGRVCEGMKAIVIREDGQEAGIDDEGELYVGGPFVARGYLGNAKRTAETFVTNPLDAHDPQLYYRTGDIVRPARDGDLRYVSRRDFQIKRNGYRIELGEIEAAAAACEGVASCAAIWEPTQGHIVIFASGNKLNKDELHKQLTHRLPTYMMPDNINLLPTLPLNANGKIDRHALLDACCV
ncbi:amino acid adenylation domain-containing protein [uncultured Olegusella sp.]|uniref:amino acid adenylation domain-containing protein n=1 Tax=uncultured Olegusella sp. TaxID=1979846 RepID=UPI0026328282|nr:amino acid adenylation domain-containing protein [uncultured Olegusella sp.]